MNNRAAADIRQTHDQYFTPRWAVEALLEYVEIPKDAIIGEPCAGAGHIVQALQENGYTTIAGEIDPGIEPIAEGLQIDAPIDFLQDGDIFDCMDWIITNPPYTLQKPVIGDDGEPERTKKGKIRTKTVAKASDFFRQAMQCAPNVAMLMRLGWLEACQDRDDLLPQLSRAIIIPRVEFIGAKGAGNSSPSVWCIWQEDKPGTELQWADPKVCAELAKACP